MKLIHLSDLHLGKRFCERSLLDDQAAILDQILGIIDAEQPDAVLIAGDIYDKSVPSAEAVQLFDGFLVALAQRRLEVFIISGNHDSPERIAFGSRLMDASGIHLSPVYDGHVAPIALKDEHGAVNFYMLPFVKPTHVRRFFEEADIVTYTDALRVAIHAMNVDTTVRNVLITHQFVTGATTCDSEELSVGGSDNVDVRVFDDFDYVALGHIHGAQNCGTQRVRYCGTPLKYSFSEVKHKKSVTVVELGSKGEELTVRTVTPLPLHEVSELCGTFDELSDPVLAEQCPQKNDYLRITLTDEDDIPDAMARLRSYYPYLMQLRYDNSRTRADQFITGTEATESKTPLALFAEFFEQQNNTPMTDEQLAFMQSLIEEIEEEHA
ncbi:MAG: exonuclease SbcCD subunit D [Clostridia bacterium]|nr:exonuclease SbcCD subunit D [Clostridia bacterium]